MELAGISNWCNCSWSMPRFRNHNQNQSRRVSPPKALRAVAVESCVVVPPPSGTKPPRGLVEFLGGAFIGAVPELTYGYVIKELAKQGFVVICVPYQVTFDHEKAAREVYGRFNHCLDSVFHSGIPNSNISPTLLSRLPLFSLAHSNGALLQVLSASYFSERIPKANAIIAYNNRAAREAVPYFEELGPLLRQVKPIVDASMALADARNTLVNAIANSGAVDLHTLISISKFVDQLPSVFAEVSQGISEFKPTPFENRERCKNSYNVKHTLLVKFNLDSIDETDVIEEALRGRVDSIGGTLEKVLLSGNHITPCIQEPKWEVGKVYTAADAMGQALKSLSLRDARVFVTTITDWFTRFQHST